MPDLASARLGDAVAVVVCAIVLIALAAGWLG